MSLDPDTTFAALKQVAGWPRLPVWAKMDSARTCEAYEALPQERKDAMLRMLKTYDPEGWENWCCPQHGLNFIERIGRKIAG